MTAASTEAPSLAGGASAVVCTKCGEQKSLSEFSAGRSQCKPCRYKVQLDYQRSPEGKATNRRARLKMLYGITQEDYDAMLHAQEGRCAICRSDDPRNPRSPGVWSVDHDHQTGAVRGLLCHRCNSSLGWYERHAAATRAYLLDRMSVDTVDVEPPD